MSKPKYENIYFYKVDVDDMDIIRYDLTGHYALKSRQKYRDIVRDFVSAETFPNMSNTVPKTFDNSHLTIRAQKGNNAYVIYLDDHLGAHFGENGAPVRTLGELFSGPAPFINNVELFYRNEKGNVQIRGAEDSWSKPDWYDQARWAVFTFDEDDCGIRDLAARMREFSDLKRFAIPLFYNLVHTRTGLPNWLAAAHVHGPDSHRALNDRAMCNLRRPQMDEDDHDHDHDHYPAGAFRHRRASQIRVSSIKSRHVARPQSHGGPHPDSHGGPHPDSHGGPHPDSHDGPHPDRYAGAHGPSGKKLFSTLSHDGPHPENPKNSLVVRI